MTTTSSHEEDVKLCMSAIQSILEIHGVDLKNAHDPEVRELYVTLEKTRDSLQKSPKEAQKARALITKITRIPCACGHPLWTHNKVEGCLHISLPSTTLKLEACSCNQYQAGELTKTQKEVSTERHINVPCPKCHAVSGEACVMKDGEHYPNASYFHAARKRSADVESETL